MLSNQSIYKFNKPRLKTSQLAWCRYQGHYIIFMKENSVVRRIALSSHRNYLAAHIFFNTRVTAACTDSMDLIKFSRKIHKRVVMQFGDGNKMFTSPGSTGAALELSTQLFTRRMLPNFRVEQLRVWFICHDCFLLTFFIRSLPEQSRIIDKISWYLLRRSNQYLTC